MKDLGDVQADGSGEYTIRVKPFSIVTVTTLDNRNKEGFSTPLPVEGERTVLDTDATGSVQNTEDQWLYADDFNYGGRSVPVIGEGGQITGEESYVSSRGGPYSVMPRYTQDLNGAFEGYLVDGTNNYVLRQQLDQTTTGVGGAWNGGDPVTAIGDYRWTNYKASADVSLNKIARMAEPITQRLGPDTKAGRRRLTAPLMRSSSGSMAAGSCCPAGLWWPAETQLPAPGGEDS